MYFPKMIVVAMLGFLALAIMPFFLVRFVVFLIIIRLMLGMMARHHFRHRFAHRQAYLDEVPEPLEMGDYRFYARRFERTYEEEKRPTYREKDLV